MATDAICEITQWMIVKSNFLFVDTKLPSRAFPSCICVASFHQADQSRPGFLQRQGEAATIFAVVLFGP
jgi:hypothetical protein